VAIRDALSHTDRGRAVARVAAVTAADTIYEIDRVSEDAIRLWFDRHWPAELPVEVVMEGLGPGEVVTFPRGTSRTRTHWKCILDPIDGTRGLMYDKRAGWMLAGVAPQRGPRTRLADIVVAAMTELPTRKQWRADQYSAVRGGGVTAAAFDVRNGRRQPLRIRPSTASDFRHGFASFARFFTTGKSYIAQMEEALWAQLHGRESEGSPLVFDDQYISTGGQLAELLAGHDRMVADIRPLVFRKLKQPTALVCHPYDICTELILREAGGIVEAPDGTPLRALLDTTSPVAWVGYANPTLAALARPTLQRVLRRFL
jgi:fructose-1,6-bisphosphatase/inositol monophosphatase family enzyme